MQSDQSRKPPRQKRPFSFNAPYCPPLQELCFPLGNLRARLPASQQIGEARQFVRVVTIAASIQPVQPGLPMMTIYFVFSALVAGLGHGDEPHNLAYPLAPRFD